MEFDVLLGSGTLVGTDKNTGYMNAASISSGAVGTPVPFPPQGATDGKLAYASQAVGNADVDNDGLADMIFSSSITRKLRYYKRLSATPGDYDLANPHDIDAVLPAAGDPRPAVIGDVTGDGKVDIILSLAGSGSTDPARTTLYLYTNLGNATFSRTAISTGLTPSSYPSGLTGKTLWDLNNDGKLDLIVYAPIGGSTALQLQVFTNVGGATPFNSSNRVAVTGATGTLLGTTALWGSLTAADFDHDGKGDLVVLGPNKKLWFLKGTGGAGFTIPASPIQTLTALNFGSHILDHTAIDGDNLADLVLTPAYSSADKPLLVFKGQGTGTTFPVTADQTVANWGTNVAPEIGACRFLPDGASCSDGNVCNGAETCSAGVCRPGAPLNCDDGNPCTADGCDAVNGCQHPPGNAGAVCRNVAGDCDVAETCTGSSSACPSDTFAAAGSVCRASTGVCDPAETCSGQSPSCPQDSFAPPTTSCDDGNSCTTSDHCTAGSCSGSAASCSGQCGSSSVIAEDPYAPACPDGTQPLGCKLYDCANGQEFGTWAVTPVCGLLPTACPSTCTTCSALNEYITATTTSGFYPVNPSPVYFLTRTIERHQFVQLSTHSLSANADSVIHVMDHTTGHSIVANAGGGSYAGESQVVFNIGERAQDVDIIVRERTNNLLSTGLLEICQTTPDNQTSCQQYGMTFGSGVRVSTGDLPPTAHVFTVEQQGGASDLVLLALTSAGPIPYVNVAGYADTGVGDMADAHLVDPCPSCMLLVATKNGQAPSIAADILYWDADVAVNDNDHDNVGDTLEALLSMNTTSAHGRDTDGDGLGDLAELEGVYSKANVLRLPYYGALPTKADILVEVDWNNSTPTAPTLASPQMPLNEATAVASYYAPDFAVHVDNGVPNTNPASWTLAGNWGGASPVATESYDDACFGLRPERRGYFHHFLTWPSAWGGGNTYQNPSFSRCSVGNNDARTVAHELGHQFGLNHGGSDDINCKPNYISIMNYDYQYLASGFSRGTLPPLNPMHVDEVSAVGGLLDLAAKPFLSALGFAVTGDNQVDWNVDGQWSGPTLTNRAPLLWGFNKGQCAPSSLNAITVDPGLQADNPSVVELDVAPGTRLAYVFWDGVSGVFDRSVKVGHFANLDQAVEACDPFASVPCAPGMLGVEVVPGSVGAQNSAVLELAQLATNEFGGSLLSQRALVVFASRSDGALGAQIMRTTLVSGVLFRSWLPLPMLLGGVGAAGTPVLVPTPDGADLLVPVVGQYSRIVVNTWHYVDSTLPDTAGTWSGPYPEYSSAGGLIEGGSVGAAAGFDAEHGSTAQTYMVATNSVDIPVGRLRFWRRNGPHSWDEITAGVTGGVELTPGTGRIGWAYVPFEHDNVTSGRFYLAYQEVGGGMKIAFTQGNSALGGSRQFLFHRISGGWTPEEVADSSSTATGLNLYYKPGGKNLRGAYSDPGHNGVFLPLADGGLDADLSDFDDYAKIAASLVASLSSPE